jgi:hypothetical protein
VTSLLAFGTRVATLGSAMLLTGFAMGLLAPDGSVAADAVLWLLVSMTVVLAVADVLLRVRDARGERA